MFAYGGVCAMFLGLKFHLKAIFLGLEICKHELPTFGVQGMGGGGGGKNLKKVSMSDKSLPNDFFACATSTIVK